MPHVAPLVCFDLGGVLLRICHSWEEGCREAGIDVRETPRAGPTLYDRNQLVIQYQTGGMDCESFFRAISDMLDGVYSPHEIQQIHRAWVIEEYPGAETLVTELRAAGLTTACLSNTNPAHWQRMPGFPSVIKLDVRLASHELRLHKPDAAIYREAESILRRSGDEILFFDDLEENVAAARDVGWRTELIDPHADPIAQMRAYLSKHDLYG